MTGTQRFFHGWAQVWRTLFRDERLRNQAMTGPHSPAEFRVNGGVRNLDAWYEAFQPKPGDSLGKHFAIESDDIEADIARLQKLGASLQEGPLKAPNGVRFAFLGVPDAVRVELVELPKSAGA